LPRPMNPMFILPVSWDYVNGNVGVSIAPPSLRGN
jgi:hypothetical protein